MDILEGSPTTKVYRHSTITNSEIMTTPFESSTLMSTSINDDHNIGDVSDNRGSSTTIVNHLTSTTKAPITTTPVPSSNMDEAYFDFSDVEEANKVSTPIEKVASEDHHVDHLSVSSSTPSPTTSAISGDEFDVIDLQEAIWTPFPVRRVANEVTEEDLNFSDLKESNMKPSPVSKAESSAPLNYHLSEEERRQAENAHYKFSASVNDNISGQLQVRKEVRDGAKVTGRYSYDDGNFYRTVWYRADENGFVVLK